MSDIKVSPALYWDHAQGCQVIGTHVHYKLDGRPAYTRLAWPVTAAEAARWLETTRARAAPYEPPRG